MIGQIQATVIVPTAGARKDYLADTVRSVLSKSVGLDFEIVVVDNAAKYDIAQFLGEQHFPEAEKVRIVKEPRPVSFVGGWPLAFSF